jgi:dolichol-phosphate mannosyltransferase
MANEGDGAVQFVRQVLARCGDFKTVTFFAVLDRVSKDNTQQLLDEYALTEPRLTTIWAPENRCVVDAYMRGYHEALKSGADWILEIDAGFSHQPSDIPFFFDAMESGYDCAFGTRFSKGGKIEDSSAKRKFISQGGTILTNFLLRTKLTDMTSGFQLFRAPVLEQVLRKKLFSRGPFFQTEMKDYCAKLNIVEIPITYRAASHAVGSNHIKESFIQLQRLLALKRANALFIPAIPQDHRSNNPVLAAPVPLDCHTRIEPRTP